MTARPYRVEWRPGTDELLGYCHCGATHSALDPIELWQWLLSHPVGHRAETNPVPLAVAGPSTMAGAVS